MRKIFNSRLALLACASVCLASFTTESRAQTAPTDQQKAQICQNIDVAIKKSILGDGKNDGSDIAAIKQAVKVSDALQEEDGAVTSNIEAGGASDANLQKQALDDKAAEHASFEVCVAYRSLSCHVGILKSQINKNGCDSIEQGQASQRMDAQLKAYKPSYDDNACGARLMLDACL